MRDEEVAARSHRDLTVWRKSVDLAELAYRLTREMPKSEEYRLSAQLIRAAASVPANIAEGNARGTRRDYAHFISIARGSAAEVETFLILTQRLKLAPEADIQTLMALTDEVSRMLNSLRRKLIGNEGA